MKNLDLKVSFKILFTLLLGTFFFTATARNVHKRILLGNVANAPDTAKRKPEPKVEDDDADRPQKKVKKEDLDHPEDGVDDDITDRKKQEVNRTKDHALNYIPVERLIEAKITKDKLLAMPRNLIKGAAGSSSISTLKWTERGPTNIGGRTRALLFDRADSTNGYKKVYAGGVGGGLWYTTDITATTITWTKINDFFDNIAISCIAQNPINPLEIYVGTGEGWDNADAIQGLGIWKTADGGKTWARLLSTSSFLYVNSVLVDKKGNVYAAVSNMGIQKSTNGGGSWTQVLGNPVQGQSSSGADLQLAANGDIYASLGIFSPGQIFLSDFTVNAANTGNSGTWTNITPTASGTITTATNNWWRIKLGVGVSSPNLMYAMFEGANTYNMTSFQQYNKTSNTWTGTVKTVPSGSSFSNGQAWYSLAISVDPNNANIVNIGSLDGERSTNGGSTWIPETQWYVGEAGLPAAQFVHADHHAYVYAPGSSSRMAIGDDGGIVYTSTMNSTTPNFINRDNTYNVTQFYSVALHPTNYNYFLAGAQDNGSQQFTKTGLNSTTDKSGGDGAFCYIDQLNGNIQIVSYTGNNYYISTNNGANFSPVGFGNGYFINPTDYDSQQKNLYCGNTAGTYLVFRNVIKTTGADTSTVSVPNFKSGNITAVAVSPVTSNRVFFGLDNGTVVIVNNANSKSTATSSILNPSGLPYGSVSCIAVDSVNEGHMLVSYFNYGSQGIFETQNAFASTPVWTNVDGNLPDMPIRWAMFYPGDPHKAIVATELGVWTTDSLTSTTTSWLPTNSGLANVEVDMLKFRPADRTLGAATHGRGLFSAVLPAAPTQAQIITFAAPPAVTYGIADFTLSATSSNHVNPIIYKSADTTIAVVTSAGKIHIKKAGTVNITASQAASKGYYAATPVTQSLKINKAVLAVTPGTQYEVAGLQIPAPVPLYTGFLNGDTQASIAVPPTMSTTATSSSPAGSYPITAIGGSSNNYTFTYTQGTLILEPQSVATGPIPVKTYGNTDFSEFGVFTPGITYTSDNPATATIVNGQIHITGAGTASITASNGINHITKTLTVNKASLTAAANNNTGISSFPIPAFSITYTGLVNGDTPASITNPPLTSTTATSSSPAGNYPINISGGSSANYIFSYVGGTLTLVPSSYYTYTIPTKTYGNVDFAEFGQTSPGISYSSSNSAVATIVNGNIHITGAGTSTITSSNGSNVLNKILTVNKAALKVTANDQTKVAGTNNPPLTVSYSGFVNQDGPTSLTTLPVATTTATVTSPAGNYPITASGGVSSNYAFNYVAGTLTVSAAIAPNIKYATPQTLALSTPITPLKPTNTGGAVPAAVYSLVTTLAGNGTAGVTNGADSIANFNNPSGIATDAAGNIYIADMGNNVIRKISTTGVVSTFAGSGAAGSADGTGTAASFNAPISVATDASGDVYVADFNNLLIRKITPAGVVTTFAGNGVKGANLTGPTDVAVDASNNVFVADATVGDIIKITQAGVTSTYAAGLNNPYGVAVDKSGNVYASDANNRVYKISSTGTVTVVAGSSSAAFADGTGLAASFNNPNCLKFDIAGDIYIDDSSNNRIRKVSPASVVTTIAGNGTGAAINGIGTAASLNFPYGSAFDRDGNLIISQASSNTISKIELSGYTISPALSAGLVFDVKTGIISGTPTVASPATNYTVTAYNLIGSSSTVINITVSATGPVATPELANVPVVHTAISPNGDAHNDVLTIDNISNYPDNKLTIVNGAGVKVYEVTGYNNQDKAFNGHSNITKKAEEEGTYFYVLQYKDHGVAKSKSGYIELKY